MPEEFDLGRMQEEAARRAREMQSRARIPQRPRQRPREEPKAPLEPEKETAPEESASPLPTPDSMGEEAHSSSEKPEESLSPSTQKGLLENLFADKERTVILALLILLSGEEGNHELLFALLFLLM